MAYIAGELEDSEALDMAEHLADCDACCAEAAEYATLVGALGVCDAAPVRWHAFDGPFGRLYLAATGRGLVRVSLEQPDDDAFAGALEARFEGHPVIRDAAALAEPQRQLDEYFSGERVDFDLAVDLEALTPFEREVLSVARRIPFGEVLPYAEVARRLRRPRASRAVGNALGHNPVPIVVPCHRVVRSDGSLGGYTGGAAYKRRLLMLEGRSEYRRAG